MGLDFSHGKASWAYSGFMRFRERLAKEIGINLREMDGFKTDNGTSLGNPLEGISWDTVDDDIKLFLNHSDCDGELSVDEMKKIIPRLKELTKNWLDKNDYDKMKVGELIAGMNEAISKNENLEFT